MVGRILLTSFLRLSFVLKTFELPNAMLSYHRTSVQFILRLLVHFILLKKKKFGLALFFMLASLSPITHSFHRRRYFNAVDNAFCIIDQSA
jgi:hypothetical protein